MYRNYWDLRTMIEDIYVYVTSDMMTLDEVRKLNKGGSHRMVISTHRPQCNRTTPDCHISLWMPININCYFYDYVSDQPLEYVEEVIQSTTYGDRFYRFGIARNRKLIKYNMIHSEWDSQKHEYELVAKPAFIQVRCDHPDDHPTSSLTDTSRRLKVVASYGKLPYGGNLLRVF